MRRQWEIDVKRCFFRGLWISINFFGVDHRHFCKSKIISYLRLFSVPVNVDGHRSSIYLEICRHLFQIDFVMRIIRFLVYCITIYTIVATFTSCCKACGDEEPRLTLSFNKFRKDELDTITVFRYQLYSNFSILIDSLATVRDWYSNDMTYPLSEFWPLPLDVEYVIKITSIGKVITLSGYQFNKQECGCHHRRVNVLSSFIMNGNVIHDTFVELDR